MPPALFPVTLPLLIHTSSIVAPSMQPNRPATPLLCTVMFLKTSFCPLYIPRKGCSIVPIGVQSFRSSMVQTCIICLPLKSSPLFTLSLKSINSVKFVIKAGRSAASDLEKSLTFVLIVLLI